MSQYYIRYNLQLFAKEGAGGEKTEEATAKKLSDARKEGQVARSADLITAFMLIAFFLILKIFVHSMGHSFMNIFHEDYSSISTIVSEGFGINIARVLLRNLLLNVVKIGGPIFIAAFVVAVVVELAQVKWKPTGKTLQPKLNKLNPISGFKKIISKEKLVDLIKSIMKLSVLLYVVYSTLREKWGLILQFYNYTLSQAIEVIGTLIIDLGLKISICFLVIAFADYFYQKKKFQKDMRMTKQEVKDEYKNTEGDPAIKGKIRQKMREVSRQRMMQSIPEADVVITNPTHFAVAIKYDKDLSSAPVVIAKGADYVAAKIKEIARENDVEIVENKPLARMIYFNVELGDEIPQELYQMVAEVLAYVYRIKNKI